MDNIRQFKKVKIALMRSKQFVGLGGLMMLGKTTMTTDVPTACTNGRDEMYNPEFIWRFGPKGVGFIIIHENLHKAGRHMTVYKRLHEIDAQLANAACDYWINQKIVDADPQATLVEMPRDENGKQMGLLDPKYRGWTVLQIFNDLRQQENPSGGDGFDDHDWDGASEMTEEQAKKLEQDIKQAIRQGQMAARKAGVGSKDDILGLTELLQSKVDWRQQLREFMNSTCQDKTESSWRRPNRRFLYNDVIMPTMVGESIKEVVFARDASGSMFFAERLAQVTGEMMAIVNALSIDRIHLIDWDGKVGNHTVLSSAQFKTAPQVKSVHGGGGTDPTCVAQFLKDNKIKPDAVIVLTDGEVMQWGTWDAPLLWVIANTQKITAPVGKTINITE